MNQILEYTDPVKGFRGYLVYDRTDCRIAAGGCRMQPDLSLETVASLASRMTLKQRVLGTSVDGAKCGISCDPHAGDRLEVLGRFVAWLADQLRSRFSMGCDMGTRFEELERLAAGVGLPSVKYAVRAAQGLTDLEFRRRMALLNARVGARTVGQRRAGHALACAAVAAVRGSGHATRGMRVGLQGFGNLGRSAAETLDEAGARVVAVADEYGCITDPGGLDVAHMLSKDQSCPVPGLLGSTLQVSGDALFDLPVDVLVLAGCSDAMTPEQAAALPVPVVVVGANNGLSPTVEQILHERTVLVIPDFIGGVGGSASMEALFGPERTPSPGQVLDLLGDLVTELVSDIISGSRSRGLPPSRVAADIAAAAIVDPDRRPYGHSPYAVTRRPLKRNRASVARRGIGVVHQTGGTTHP